MTSPHVHICMLVPSESSDGLFYQLVEHWIIMLLMLPGGLHIWMEYLVLRSHQKRSQILRRLYVPAGVEMMTVFTEDVYGDEPVKRGGNLPRLWCERSSQNEETCIHIFHQ